MSINIDTETRIRTLYRFPTFIFLFLIFIISILITALIPGGKKLATKIYHYFGWLGVKMVGVNLTISGIENVNTERSYIVVGNHPSTLDIFTHIHALPVSIRFLTKTELFRWPFFGRVLKILGLPRIDRKNAQLNLPEINKSISNVIAEGNSIMIFPEGTRSNQKDLLPFKKGAGKIYEALNLPCVPVALNTGKVWPKNSFLKYSNDIKISFLEPVEPGKDKNIFINEIETKIYKEIDNLA